MTGDSIIETLSLITHLYGPLSPHCTLVKLKENFIPSVDGICDVITILDVKGVSRPLILLSLNNMFLPVFSSLTISSDCHVGEVAVQVDSMKEPISVSWSYLSKETSRNVKLKYHFLLIHSRKNSKISE